MIIVIEGTPYGMVNLHDFSKELTFNQLLAFNRQLAVSNISRCRTMDDVLGLLGEVKALKPTELMAHPEGCFLLGVLVWAARTVAGERITLLDACDFRISDLSFVNEPSDPAGAPEGKARRGSGLGAGNHPRKRKK